jgi:hypothetical protein
MSFNTEEALVGIAMGLSVMAVLYFIAHACGLL